MALTNSGFDGTVNEAQFAKMWALGGADAVADGAAWLVSQGTGRQVSTAAGNAFARGVLSENSAAILTSLSTPTNGQWFLIVRRVSWAANTVTVAAIGHTTTSTTVPTAPPSTLPGALNNNPGVIYDQLLAWAWVNSVNTTVTLFDLRTMPVDKRIADAVATVAALPASDNWPGRNLWVEAENASYVWRANVWTRTHISDSLTVVIPTANTNVDTAILFGTTFASPPNVVATPSSPLATVGVSMVTETGFLLTTRRSTTTNTVVTWIAVLT